MSTLNGKVQKGKGLGKKLGFSTINIFYDGEEKGSFVGRVNLEGEWFPAAIYVDNICEAYLLNFESEIEEGTKVEVELIEKIRDVEKFENNDLLKEQIAKDVEFVRNWYNAKDQK